MEGKREEGREARWRREGRLEGGGKGGLEGERGQGRARESRKGGQDGGGKGG